VIVLPVGSGEPRTLLRVNWPERLRGDQSMSPAWTPDGGALIVAKVLMHGTPSSELWRVPIDGSAPRKLDIDVENWTGDGFRLSPDGRRIAFVATAGKQRLEIWAVENFLPALAAKK
jgi:Tol biopolymer transport system component